MNKKNFLLVAPANDGESVEAANLARQHGVKVLVTKQPWGASWTGMEGSTGLEPEVEQAIHDWRAENPTGTVYGLELRGENDLGAENIDHHRYTLPGGVVDDRHNPKSSLEQVADLLGVELTDYQQLVSANDKGYVPAMESQLRSQGVDPASPNGQGFISLVRQADRCAQGVTPDDEAQAVADVEAAEWRGRKVLLRITTALGTAQGDLLYGKADEQLHINQMTGKWIYFGPKHQTLNNSGFSEQHWAGGAPESGYFSIVSPGQETQQKILAIFWAEDKK
jgi:hypothetical protein